MATYKTLDLMKVLSSLLNDGYFFVDVTEDEDSQSKLLFDVLDEDDFPCKYDEIESSPEEESIFITDSDYIAAFTRAEVSLLHQAVSNALEYYKDCQNDPSYPKEIKADIKSSAIKTRNMQAKLVKMMKPYQ